MQRKIPFQATALAAAPATAVAQGDPGYYGHMMGWGAGMLWSPFFWIFCLAFVIIIVFVVMGLAGGRDSRGNSIKNESINILKNRYARGDITTDEYESMRRDLER